MTKEKRDNLIKQIVAYAIPLIIGGGAGAGAGMGSANVEIATMKEQIKQLQEEKEILFKHKANKEDVDRLLISDLKSAERFYELKGRVDTYHK